jgi:scratch
VNRNNKMSQKNISSYFKPKQVEIGDEQSDKAVTIIKKEPLDEFMGLLLGYRVEQTLLGDFIVTLMTEEIVNDPENEAKSKSVLKTKQVEICGEENKKIVNNIKEEPPVEFLCLLPEYRVEQTLLGEFKVKKEEKVENFDNEKSKGVKVSKTRVKCSICSLELLKASLRMHSWRKHKIQSQKPKIECKICSKKFFYKSRLVKHLKTHELKYQCKLCDQWIKDKCSYDDHMKVHEDPEAFQCEICSTNFIKKFDLKQHLLSHLHEVYKCRHCSKYHKFNEHLVWNLVKKLCACE